MIEIYLFVNPLDESSLKSEKKFLEIIKQEKEKIHFKVIPLLNPRVLQNYILRQNLPSHDLDIRNYLFNTIYSACLDYKAVQLQGKRLGKDFLIELQSRVGCKKQTYSKALVRSILDDLGADMPLFVNDRSSDLIIDFFKLDQQVANEMGIEDFSDAVIFNYNCERDFGVLIEADTPIEIIKDLFKTNCLEDQLSENDNLFHLF